MLIVAIVASLSISLIGPVTAAETSTNVTFVESDITANTTWTPDGGPYRIVQDVQVAPGATLTIRPGTEVQLAERITLSVDGSLYANGTADRPVTVSQTDGAAANRRWASIRYNGTDTSRLTVRNTTLEGGTSGITVDSSDGAIRVVDSTLRNFATAGLSVSDTAATPSITIERSAFRLIDGHAIRATPSMGTTGDVSLTASPSGRDLRSEHTLSLDAGVGVAFDTIELRYLSDGSVGNVESASLKRIGLDRNRNGSVEQSFGSLVTDVSSTDGRLRISLSRPVKIPSDGRLLVEYEDAVNPSTRGIYPVGVDLRKESISQLSDGVRASFVVGNVTSPIDRSTSVNTRANRLTVRGSSFNQVGGNGIFVAADTVRRLRLFDNRISETDGSGIAVRAARSEMDLSNNDISADDAGVQIDARSQTSMAAYGNRIHDAQTGIRIHQSGTQVFRAGEISIRKNTLTDNVGHGIGIDARTTKLRFHLTDNTIRDNGRDGVNIQTWLTRRSSVDGNQITDNGDDGFALAGAAVSNLTLAHNEVVNNSGTGMGVQTRATARKVTIHNNTVRDGTGHGVTVRSDLLIHQVDVRENRLANNAGSGLLVASPITHRSNLSVVHNTIAANSYGVIVRGAVETAIRENDIVFNTNAFTEPVPVSDVYLGTGVYVAEGSSGVIVNQAQAKIPLEELVANPEMTEELTVAQLWDDTVVVLRTDGESETRPAEASSLLIRQVSGTTPTGVGIQKSRGSVQNHRIVNNSVYGQHRGLVVDMAPLINVNTTARIIVDPIRTVHAESNYWGTASGPYHSSILPAGDGNSVVTERGWVDFTPFRTATSGPRYERPTTRIEAPATATAKSQLRLSGANSTSNHSPVGRYHFVVNGTAQPAQSSPVLNVTMPNQSLEVRLSVENRLGIDSNNASTATIDTAEPVAMEQPAQSKTTSSNGPLTSVDAIDSGGLSAGLGSIWGLLGGVLYLGALVLGGHGMVLTLQNRSTPVSGRRIQGLAVAGVLVWVVGGLVSAGPLVSIGIVAVVSWGGLTAVAYVLATRG
ncbi:right-handed parallel beta-helix repeat-containing protein (plasmid) [Haloferax mediterranei ATCC 33500]|uniref:Right-handed parallel beta-helix repeat-containing protein n=1 Tax=Haloferax mediterranei (strain ATCC 33500 / DSM 1411 / JCM 8866 / NBRC 14739 / NCIMB 2177 / R-4) TaxID=523841 RepID=I3RBH7_HALMT|nr:right-handed parallel beta-helix repeat-containing protein [Haloferax mediterranei]AFK21587.1 hypothetical protein HFX_6471 [Haloferax mediterranei ATCC 33500]AHZ24366.1 hypothetical protein BM92_15705 [Haloferax mediterranei ATCC 33500]ELZ97103.1 hypothetical protein C439_17313 [Haloferax mediterranei ATCC 33500]MDX5990153.1 right-handed parallel beta-helix repeat-containing protein [Haloferax mediterranei ATCC 33500]QCQ77077.1 right-handed parallel beta-helix repeat-containing protein [Ha